MMQDMYTAMGISPEVYEYGEQTRSTKQQNTIN